MYSRSRMHTAEQRYAENLPPVYGGSRFYRGASAPPAELTPIRDTTPAGGIPVEYTVRPAEEPEVSPPQEADMPADVPLEQEAACAARPVREGGLSALLSGDSEEILLIVLILLLGGEAERAADVIVILLLLLTVR